MTVHSESYKREKIDEAFNVWRLDRKLPNEDFYQLFQTEDSIDLLVAKYSVFRIEKKSGTYRQIQAPQNFLKKIQQDLLNQMKEKFKLHPAAMAVAGKSYIDNASLHLGAKHVLKADILNFYTSTKKKTVDHVLELFFPEQVEWMKQYSAFFYYRDSSTQQPWLPTGAPTSPFIGNIVLYPIDVELTSLANKLGAKYSRYLDDITLSFTKDLNCEELNEIRNTLSSIFTNHGWVLHPGKTRWINPQNDCFTVTGVDIRTEQKVSSKYIREKVRPAIESSVKNLFSSFRIEIPAFFPNRKSTDFQIFEDILPVLFSDILPLLSYVKQVNKEQYAQLVDHLRYRLNRIGSLTKHDARYIGNRIAPIVSRQCGISFNTLVLSTLHSQLSTIKTIDEALLVTLQFCAQHAQKDKIDKNSEISDDPPF